MSIKGSLGLADALVENIYKDVKILVLEAYYKEHSKLKWFLVQVDLYLTFYSTHFSLDTKRVL